MILSNVNCSWFKSLFHIFIGWDSCSVFVKINISSMKPEIIEVTQTHQTAMRHRVCLVKGERGEKNTNMDLKIIGLYFNKYYSKSST